jgi:hypothetical protein
MNPGPETPPPLQFDTVVPTRPADAAAPPAGVRCVACQQLVADEYFDINGHPVCAGCRDAASHQVQTPTGAGVLMRAAGLGIVAAILGAIVYYGVMALTNFEIGIVAIAIGYMVGYGIRLGTGGRGGRRFQVLAVVLTYWAVGLAYTPFVFSEAGNEQPAQVGDGVLQVGRGAGAGASTAPATPVAADDAAEGTGLGYALVVILGLTFALPVLSVVSSLPGGLISAAIIAFGMHQAWKMTSAPHLAISGPYRVGDAPVGGVPPLAS